MLGIAINSSNGQGAERNTNDLGKFLSKLVPFHRNPIQMKLKISSDQGWWKNTLNLRIVLSFAQSIINSTLTECTTNSPGSAMVCTLDNILIGLFLKEL